MMLLQTVRPVRTLLKDTPPLKMQAGAGTTKSMIALLCLVVKVDPLATSQRWCGREQRSWDAGRAPTTFTTAISKVMIRLIAPHQIAQDVMKTMSQHRSMLRFLDQHLCR